MNKSKDIVSNKLITKIFIIALFVLSSCFSGNKIRQDQEYNKRIKSFNDVTNKYCSSLGLDFSRDNPIRSEMFFRCKIELAKRAKITNPLKPEEMIFNQDLKKYITLQDRKYMDSIENLNYYRNSILNNSHHKLCEKRGYKIDSLKQEEIERYLSCRKILIMSFEIKPAYQDSKNLNYRQSSYNINYVVNKKQDQEIKLSKKFNKKYPFCSKYKLKSKEALECQEYYDKKTACVNKVRTDSFARKRKFHEICQQKLYIKLPDSLIIDKDNKYAKSQLRNFNTDLNLNPSYYEFLSNKDMMNSFKAKDKKKKSTSDEKQKEEEKKINNSFDKLYTRNELTGLRQRFIRSCVEEIEPKLANFIDSSIKICSSITLRWERNDKPKR